jgi:hypothetical protein
VQKFGSLLYQPVLLAEIITKWQTIFILWCAMKFAVFGVVVMKEHLIKIGISLIILQLAPHVEVFQIFAFNIIQLNYPA